MLEVTTLDRPTRAVGSRTELVVVLILGVQEH